MKLAGYLAIAILHSILVIIADYHNSELHGVQSLNYKESLTMAHFIELHRWLTSCNCGKIGESLYIFAVYVSPSWTHSSRIISPSYVHGNVCVLKRINLVSLK